MRTQAIYAKVFDRLVDQAGGPELPLNDGVRLCAHVASRVSEGKISWATAKQYASVIRWRLRKNDVPLEAFEAEWRSAQRLRKCGKPKRKSSHKVSITVSEITAINSLAALREERSFITAATLFHVGVLLGLRPCEWANARWANTERTTLIVRNAKTASTVLQHGPFAGRLWVRGNGAERSLKLTPEGITAGVPDLVDAAMRNEKALPWESNRGTIWRAFKRLVKAARSRDLITPKFANLTIYSARHQFAADAKHGMDVGAGEVAAAMGHSAVRTAIGGYGRRHSGGKFAPSARPDAASIEAVQSKLLRPARPKPKPQPKPRPKPAPGPSPSFD